MDWKKVYKFLCCIWFLLLAISLAALNMPMLWIGGKGTAESSYNGFQLLFCKNITGNFVNQTREVVIGRSLEFIILKILIAAQLVFGILLIVTLLLGWKKKVRRWESCLLAKGMLSAGYMLMAFMAQEYVKICIANQNACIKSVAYQHQSGLEKNVNIIFSICVMVLFVLMAFTVVMQTNWKKSQKLLCYMWLLVPMISFAMLNIPIISIGTSGCFAAVPGVQYSGFQLLFYDNLVNQAQEAVIGQSLALTVLKILIAARLIFDIILIFIWLLEWKKPWKRKLFLWIRGIISMGYVLMALGIQRYVQICMENRKNVFGSYVNIRQPELEENIIFSICVMVLFVITLQIFCKTCKNPHNGL